MKFRGDSLLLLAWKIRAALSARRAPVPSHRVHRHPRARGD
jgi:hypothetical protein